MVCGTGHRHFSGFAGVQRQLLKKKRVALGAGDDLLRQWPVDFVALKH